MRGLIQFAHPEDYCKFSSNYTASSLLNDLEKTNIGGRTRNIKDLVTILEINRDQRIQLKKEQERRQLMIEKEAQTRHLEIERHAQEASDRRKEIELAREQQRQREQERMEQLPI